MLYYRRVTTCYREVTITQMCWVILMSEMWGWFEFLSDMDPQRKQAFYFSCASRIGFLLLSCISDLLIPDLRSDGFKTAAYDPSTSLHGFWRLQAGLLRWDAHHYLHIAQFGYTYENNLAFFPLFPFVVRSFGFLFSEIVPLIDDKLAALLLGALIFNNFIFVKSSLALYDLTLYMFNDTEFAYMTSVFFCVSPATIFFIAPYTESFFLFVLLKGFWISPGGKPTTHCIGSVI